MKIKHTVALGLSLLLVAPVFASPLEIIDLQANGKVEANSAAKVSLGNLRKDENIYYNVTCELNNPTQNPELPISFYPKKGEVGDIAINGKHIGTGDAHTSVNIPNGQSKLVMNHVNRKENQDLVIVNGSTKKGEDLILVACKAKSVN